MVLRRFKDERRGNLLLVGKRLSVASLALGRACENATGNGKTKERPEGLTPMVAAAWRENLYVGNRRLWISTSSGAATSVEIGSPALWACENSNPTDPRAVEARCGNYSRR